jgi:hypothetical protein
MVRGNEVGWARIPSERQSGPFGPADYLMIQSLRLTNFRCYKSLLVDGLRRVNVIVGGNGTGKTALLESIFLAGGGSPELGLRLKNFRGIAAGTEIGGGGLRELWADLFYNFDQSVPVAIRIQDTTSRRPRLLTVSLAESEEMSLPIEESEGESGIVRNIPIDFAWSDSSGNFKSRPIIENGRITFPSVPKVNLAAFFAAHFKLNPEETARRLSDLSKGEELSGMVDLIHQVYGEVENISVEHHAGAWQTFVKLDGRGKRIPIGLHSAGVSKFVAIMLGVASMVGGCVLIDELENGFYYEKLTPIWEALYEMAAVSSCQLFVTTHSKECLKALQPVLEKHNKHFALLKTENNAGRAEVFMSEGDVMTSAIESGFELR